MAIVGNGEGAAGRRRAVVEPLESRLLLASWAPVVKISPSYGSGLLSAAPEVAVSPVTDLPYAVFQTRWNRNDTNAYVINFARPVRRPDGSLDWSGTQQTPVEVGGRGYKQQNPTIAVGSRNGQEQIHVAYYNRFGTNNFMYSRSTDGGQTWSAPFDFSQADEKVVDKAALAADDQGNVYTVWTDWSGRSNQNQLDVWFRKFDGGTQQWLPKKKIESNAATKSSYPAVFVRPGGQNGAWQVHAAWADRGLTPPPISYTVSLDGGNTFSAPEAALVAPSGKDVHSVALAVAADGTVHVAGHFPDSDSTPPKPIRTAYKRPGQGWSASDEVSNTNPASNPFFTADRSGRVYFSWMRDVSGDEDMFFKQKDGDAALNWDEPAPDMATDDNFDKGYFGGQVAVNQWQTVPSFAHLVLDEQRDGLHQIYWTYADVQPPAADVIDVTPDPRTAAVPSATIAFTEPVVGFDLSDLRLTRDGSPVPLTGATLTTTDNNRTFTLNNLSGLTGASGTYTLTVVAPGTGVADRAGQALSADASDTWQMTAAAPASVVGRHVFYNHAVYDTGTEAGDDASIAPDKVALRPGQQASAANVTGYVHGINGVMIDVADLPPDVTTLGAGDITFRVGNDANPAAWSAAPPPAAVTVRRSAGVNGSARVVIKWADGTIRNRWLRVTLNATAATGLAAADVFQFGNLVGDADGSRTVNLGDFGALRQDFGRTGLSIADGRSDFNRDGKVDLADFGALRQHFGWSLSAPPTSAGASPARSPSSATTAARATDLLRTDES